VTGPTVVHSFKDTKKDSFTTAAGGKGTHGANPATHLEEESFNDIGSAQSFPMGFRTIKERQELF
jgi:hypothetical protein